MMENEEWVINVHGTFAELEEDAGDAWWQSGSPFCDQLSQRLSAGISILPAEKTFHWSGKNSEREREKAARDLLEFLKTLDRPFHIVAHSHGGSLVWRMLKMSLMQSVGGTSQDKPAPGLPLLKSWTTMGTPFFSFAPRQVKINMFTMVFRLASVLAFLGIFASMGYLLYAFISLIPGLLWSVNLWWLLAAGLGMVVCPLILIGNLGSTAGFLESLTLAMEEPMDLWASRAYASRWLPVWSEDDEAILGIQSAQKLFKPVVPRFFKPDPIFITDRITRFFRWPVDWFWEPLNNYVIAPIGDRFFWNVVRNLSSGNDKPGTRVAAINAGPSAHLSNPPRLPQTVEDDLVNRANDALAAAAPRLRPALLGMMGDGELVLEGTDEKLLTGRELVHTSYYLDNFVIEAIAAHITERSPDSEVTEKMPLANWLQEINTWKTTQIEALASLGDPARWSVKRWLLETVVSSELLLGVFVSSIPFGGGRLMQMMLKIWLRSEIDKEEKREKQALG